MKNEGKVEEGESGEHAEEIFAKEIQRQLSPIWAKSVQELLPGYLPNKPRLEYTEAELRLYQTAYKIVSEMVKQGIVEVEFKNELTEPIPNLSLHRNAVDIPKFKLISGDGKRSEDPGLALQADLVME